MSNKKIGDIVINMAMLLAVVITLFVIVILLSNFSMLNLMFAIIIAGQLLTTGVLLVGLIDTLSDL